MQRSSKPLLIAALACFFSASLTLGALAQDKKIDPTGTWTWDMPARDGQTRTATLKLKLEGDKLTGAVARRDGTDTPIRNAKLAGDQITFQTVFEMGNNTFTTKYSGKVSGDTIKGTTEFERGGEVRSREWVAKRKSDVTGTWQYRMTAPGGQTFEPKLRLKQEGDQVTGFVVFNENERPISEGKVSNGEVSFKMVRERDGRSFASKYAGKVEGDTLKGKITSSWGDTERVFDLEAKRVKE
jgi:hypothetical protein